MESAQEGLLLGLIFAFATLYSILGQGGGSGYLAAMAMVGLAPEALRPAALSMNIAVSALVVWRYARADLIDWPLIRPFLFTSLPMALLGGLLTLPTGAFRGLVGLLLCVAGAWLLVQAAADAPVRAPANARALSAGAAIGLVSGLTGIGGAILLAPLLQLCRWATPQMTNAVSGVFVLLNSVAGLTGLLLAGASMPLALPGWIIAAVLGGLLGSWLGLARFDGPTLRRLLALVLVIAGARLVWV